MEEEEKQAVGFDDARQKTEALFEGEPKDTEGVSPVPEEETPHPAPEEQGVIPQEPAQEPVQEEPEWRETLRGVTEVAEQSQGDLRQALSAIEQLKAQNEQLQEMVRQMSDTQEKAVIANALAPPKLDIGAFMFEDEETQRAAAEDYSAKMQAYAEQIAEQKITEKMAPYIEEANRAKEQKEQDNLISIYATMPEFSDINELRPSMDRIIEKNPYMKELPADQRIVNAYLMARGVRATHEDAHTPTTDELMALYEGNQEFRDAVEKKRIAALNGAKDVPPMSSSTGAVGAALNIPEAPKDFDEAAERTRKMFRK